MTTRRLIAWLTLLIVPTAVLHAEECSPSTKRDYQVAMRKFVQDISAAAKRANPGFLVVPQAGIGLVTDTGKPDGKPVEDYLHAIDGVGQEEVFYGIDNKDNLQTPPMQTDYFVKQLGVIRAAGKTVLVTDYANKRHLMDDAYAKNAAAGFVPFVADRRGLNRVPTYPAQPVNENTADVKALKDVKNFLYVIDGSKFKSKKKYLAAMAQTNYDLLLIDPLTGNEVVTADELKPVKTKANGGRRLVLCYVSIGQAEDYRFYWKKGWKPGNPAFIGPEDPDWKGNFAVKYWEPAWQAIFVGGKDSYLARVQTAEFDGIYLDRVDYYAWFETHGE